jgi:hypothetical protein
MKLGHEDRHGDKKSYRCAHGSSCFRTFITPPVSIAIDAIINTIASLVSAAIGNLSLMSPAMGQPGTLTKTR